MRWSRDIVERKISRDCLWSCNRVNGRCSKRAAGQRRNLWGVAGGNFPGRVESNVSTTLEEFDELLPTAAFSETPGLRPDFGMSWASSVYIRRLSRPPRGRTCVREVQGGRGRCTCRQDRPRKARTPTEAGATQAHHKIGARRKWAGVGAADARLSDVTPCLATGESVQPRQSD